MVRRGLAADAERARADIEAGRVTVAGAPAENPARLIGAGDPVVVHGPGPRFVSRGGDKLDAALDRFAIDVAGRRALDAGASTGGFTDCLLQRGAGEVVAVDVGYGQLHEHLLADARVHNLERTNLREIDLDAIGAPFDLAVADLSFISLVKVVDVLLEACHPGSPVVVLVKPQFEAGHTEVSRGQGVVTDPAIWRRVLIEVKSAFEARRAAIMGCMVSPLRGAHGNVEFLLAACSDPKGSPPVTVDVDAVVDEAVERWPN